MEEKSQFLVPLADKVSRKPRRSWPWEKFLGCACLLLLLYHTNHQQPSISSPPSLATLSERYLNVLSATNLAAKWSYEFTKAPHLAGTNIELANWQKKKFEDFGLCNVETEDFDVYLNYPSKTSLKLIDANSDEIIYHPTLKEDQLDEDPTTNSPGLIPAFHGYSASGNITAKYIYANYGTVGDFQKLIDNNVNITGKIVIVRYGKIFRGLKVRFAQNAGAVGVLIYSEPSDDGEITVDHGYAAYPNGPARNPSAIQRGSVQFLSQIPGDPTTPGWPSKGDDIHRVDPHHSIPSIPSLPISYSEVVTILKALNGHGLKFDGWEGDLSEVNYNIGPNPDLSLNMFNLQDYKINKIFNVYGEIEGHLKDEVILLGNHRDAWIKGGAGDPNSGSATMMEIIRALHELQMTGWKPYRTIRFASWDGEEYGLIGSTEFGELYHKELQKKVIAYLNLDVGTSGSHLKLQGSPLLYKLLNENAQKIKHPIYNKTLFDHFYENKKFISILGSGSDFTVFLEHLGIASIDLGFTPANKDPIYHYHSNYDSYHWMNKFGDPGFKLHNTMAKYLGLVTLDLVENKILRFGAIENSELIKEFFELTVKKVPCHWLNEPTNYEWTLVGTCCRQSNLPFENSVLDEEFDDLLQAFSDSGVVYDNWNDNSHYCDLAKMKEKSLKEIISLTNNSINSFIGTSYKIEARMVDLKFELDDLERRGYSPWNPIYRWKLSRIMAKIAAVNSKLKFVERYFLYYKGLTGRKWFRHIIYAAGRNTGYSGQVFPGLSEAIEDDDMHEFVKWLFIINSSIRKANKHLKLMSE
ncbi:hypothetical protein DASC09_000070 [Saccharomycopsis crataegensis]|uniref:Vacuolar protein sorting-associated protein 70 n=1 Tax=Saccharomycopsis crataegensis TaxID=43959 RepID=A0AAV5QD58_9ASCO|nr:hypothetical protein DASC09_000070 [Saccharomycopsis crataegensis]